MKNVMETTYHCLLVASLLTLPLSICDAQTDVPKSKVGGESENRVAELNELWRQAEQAAAAGQLNKAVALANNALKIQVELTGQVHLDTAVLIEHIANMRELQGDYAKAVRARRMVLHIRERLLDLNHWQVAESGARLEDAESIHQLSEAGRIQLDDADNRIVVAKVLQQEQKFDVAIRATSDALAIYEKLLGKRHKKYVANLKSLAVLHQHNGDLDRAKSVAREAIELLAGNPNFELAEAKFWLAGIHLDSQNREQADQVFSELILLFRKTLGTDNALFALTLNEYGLFQYKQGRYVQAKSHLIEAKTIYAKLAGKHHPKYLETVHRLALVQDSLAIFEDAETSFREAIEIAEELFGQESLHYAEIVSNLAGVYEQTGEYRRAQPLYSEAIELYDRLVGKDIRYATAIGNLALLHKKMGDYLRAEELYLETISIRERIAGKSDLGLAPALQNIGNLYLETGQLNKALSCFERAKTIYEEAGQSRHANYAAVLNGLASTHVSLGNFDKAQELRERCLPIVEEVLGGQHPYFATTLHNMALDRELSGDDYERARELLIKARAIREKSLGKEHPEYVTTLHALGRIARVMRDWPLAEQFFVESLKTTHNNLKLASYVQSDRSQMAMSRVFRYQLDDFLSLAVDVQADAEVNSDISDRLIKVAYNELLQWKGAVFSRQHQLRRAAINSDTASQFDALKKVSAQLSTLGRKSPEPDQAADWRLRLRELREKKEQLEITLSSQSSTFRDGQLPVSSTDVLKALPQNAALIDFLIYTRKIIPAESVRPKRIEVRRSLLAFVVQPEKGIHLVDLGAAEDIASHITAWRQGFGANKSSKEAGARLRTLIWEPLMRFVHHGQVVLLSLDGELATLPFAALPGRDESRYLIEDYKLTTIPAARMLPLMSNRPISDGTAKLLVFGDIDYDAELEELLPDRKSTADPGTTEYDLVVSRGHASFVSLPSTATEIKAIQKLFLSVFDDAVSEATLLGNKAATVSQFRRYAPDVRYLHLATHGFFSKPQEDDPQRSNLNSGDLQQPSFTDMISDFNPSLLSGIAFAGANRLPDAQHTDGILTSTEISGLLLKELELVVLSACETALGKVAGGEGLLGIQRAFQVAGAKSTIASLWNVEDRATMVLMARFYKNLWEKKMSKLDALRESQIWMLNNPDKIWDDETYAALRGDARRRPIIEQNKQQRLSPEFWAAFSLSGDWR